MYTLAVGLDNWLVYVSSMDEFCRGLVSQPHLVTVSYLIEEKKKKIWGQTDLSRVLHTQWPMAELGI